jgi:hypothetical protein
VRFALDLRRLVMGLLDWLTGKNRLPSYFGGYTGRSEDLCGIVIENPSDQAVRIRIPGASPELASAGSHGTAAAVVTPGSHHIRYQFDGSSQVYEGDEFDVSRSSVAKITLKGTPGGNYHTWPVSGSL